MIRLFNRLHLWITQRCADCSGPIGQDSGPPDGWQLEDDRTVCHACCVADFGRHCVALPNAHHLPSTMIQLTHATQQALARIATAPATSEQGRRSPLAEAAPPLGDPACPYFGVGEPEPQVMSDEEICNLWTWAAGQDLGPWPTQQHCFARALIARCARTAIEPVPRSWAELTDQQVMEIAPVAIPSLTSDEADAYCAGFRRCAEAITFTIEPVPVAERLPGPTMKEVSDWVARQDDDWTRRVEHHDAIGVALAAIHDFMHHALPVPGAEVQS